MTGLGQLGAIIAALLGVTVPAARLETRQIGPPPVTYPAVSGPCTEWAPTAFDVGWPVEQWPTISRVMWCESKCQPWAHNRSGASGLMQIMPMWWDGRDPYDPTVNLTMALEIRERQGWRAWSCY